jgi:ABC-type sugar transport system substrate-binding protein
MHFMRDDYAIAFREAFRKVCQEEGVSVVATDGAAKASKQLADLESLLARKIDVLVIIPWDEKAVLRPISRANQLEIPVVAVTQIPGAKVRATVDGGDRANGRAAGKLLVEKLGGKGKVALLDIPVSMWRIQERVEGFREALKGTNIDVVVHQKVDTDDKAMRAVADILSAHPDLAGIFATFSNQILGAAAALRNAGRKDVVLTGIDADKAIIKMIRAGWVTGTAAQFPRDQGTKAAQAAVALLRGEPVKELYSVPTQTVDYDNAPQMQEVIWGIKYKEAARGD